MVIAFLHFLFLYLSSSQIWLNPDHHFLSTGKTSNKICNVFCGMLIECNNLQGISENKMLAPMGIPFYEMPQVVFFHMTLDGYSPNTSKVSWENNNKKKLSICTPCNALDHGYYLNKAFPWLCLVWKGLNSDNAWGLTLHNELRLFFHVSLAVELGLAPLHHLLELPQLKTSISLF